MTHQSDMLDEAQWEQELADLHQQLAPHFRRVETRERVRRYLLGLLSAAQRKNSWQLAETMHEPGLCCRNQGRRCLT